MNIFNYCKKEVPGWTKIEIVFPGHAPLSGFLCTIGKYEGIQLMVDIHLENTVHASLSVIASARPDISKDQLFKIMMDNQREILSLFFGGREFTKAPDRPNHPYNKHLFSLIEQLDFSNVT